MAKKLTQRNDIFVKWVKKANMWCKTWWDDKGAQKQEWFIEKPDMLRPEK